MRVAIVLLVAVLSACSSQAVELQPEVLGATPYASANGQLVTVAIRDERPSETIGTRGATVRLGDITAAGEVNAILSRTVSTTLEQRGFRVQESTPMAATLVVDLRNLSFAEHMGVWTGKRVAEAAVNARVMRNGAIIFEKLYRGSNISHGMTIGTAHGNAGLINSALSDALQQLVSDPELMAALSSVRQ
jgi:uncharacterized lipoprotein YajG